jgi:hypothetical protein
VDVVGCGLVIKRDVELVAVSSTNWADNSQLAVVNDEDLRCCSIFNWQGEVFSGIEEAAFVDGTAERGFGYDVTNYNLSIPLHAATPASAIRSMDGSTARH